MLAQMSAQNRYETRKANTARRHQLIRDRIDKIYAQRIEGIPLDYDRVIDRVASEYGLASTTVKEILKSA